MIEFWNAKWVRTPNAEEKQEREEDADWPSLVLFQVCTVITSIKVLDVKIENLRHLFDMLIEANIEALCKRKDSYLQ